MRMEHPLDALQESWQSSTFLWLNTDRYILSDRSWVDFSNSFHDQILDVKSFAFVHQVCIFFFGWQILFENFSSFW
jgi:hypothetical protein